MRWARLRFEQVFRNDVQQLVYNLPADKLLENGQKFWSGTKRCPTPLQFDVNDPAHMAFVVCAANLHAVSNGVPAAERHSDEAKFKQFLASVEIPPFTPSDGVKIATTDADAKKEEEEGNGEAVASVADTTAKLKTQINEAVTTLGHEAAGVAFSPAEFEKDDDSNFHVDFMTVRTVLLLLCSVPFFIRGCRRRRRCCHKLTNNTGRFMKLFVDCSMTGLLQPSRALLFH